MNDQHVRLKLRDTPVFFPFQPYDTQKDYMQDVIECLDNRKHAILESPTGTGKTLSLLCSTLAWIDNNNGREKSLIYYTSRTHMQLSQAAKEMKRTAYARKPAVVLASRTHLCINQEVKNSGENLINRACRNAIVKNACSYYSNYEQKLESMNHESVHDIEDLYQFGKSHECCPYYASKKLAETKASLVFMPYNYLLDTSLSKNNPLRLNNSVLIVDEAHNIDSILKDSVSGSFTESNLKTIQLSCRNLPEKLSAALNRELHGLSRSGYDPSKKLNQVVDEFSKKKDKSDKEAKPNPIEELAAILTTSNLNRVSDCATKLMSEVETSKGFDKTKPIDDLYDLMDKAAIRYSSSDIVIKTLDAMSSFWSIAGVMDPKRVAEYVVAITNLRNVISVLFPEECLSAIRQRDHRKKLDEYYSVHLQGIYKDSQVLNRGERINWEYHVWCLHPAIGLKRVIESSMNGPRSIIITSGTLQPLDSYRKELELTGAIAKQYKHLIGDNQLKISVLPESPDSYSLASHYKAQNDAYYNALGKTLLALFKVLPYGTLIFFQSYTLMNKAVGFWKRSNLWRDMTKVTKIFIESQSKHEFEPNLNEFKRILTDSNIMVRSVFLGVCRGKLSEGINLEGNQCRTVLMTGLPFANAYDPRVLATRDFHQKKNGDSKGQIWYSQQMVRALNQTVGRVIRNKNDFGMLILCDPRFKEYRYSLSEWMRQYFPNADTRFADIGSEIREHFAQHDIHVKETISHSLGAFEWSPFSEEASSRSSRASRSSGRARNGSNMSSPQVLAAAESRAITAEERQKAMVACYTVDRDTYSRIQSSRAPQNGDGNSGDEVREHKRQKTTQDMLELICSQPDLWSQPVTLELTQDSRIARRVQQSPDSLPPPFAQTSPDVSSSQPDEPERSPSTSNAHSNGGSGSQQVSKRKPGNPFAQKKQQQSSSSSSKSNYSVIRDQLRTDRPAPYTCYICDREAENPHRLDCDCQKVGCYDCLKVRHRKVCGKCKKVNNKRYFRDLKFNSASTKEERYLQNKCEKK